MKRLVLTEIAKSESGRHSIFFEADDSRILSLVLRPSCDRGLVVRVLHDRMDYRRHLSGAESGDEA